MRQTISTPEQLGLILQSARRKRKLTQKDLALVLDQSQASVSRIETTPQTMTLQQLLTLCHRLGLELVVRERAAAGPAGAPGADNTEAW